MNIYATGAVTRVVNDLADQTPTFLRSSYFGAVQTSEDEFIALDKIEGKPRVAPFVAPHMPGKIVEDRGYATDFIRPAYVKPKSELRPARYQKRMPGEPIGGNLAPIERAAIDLRNKQQEHVSMMVVREEIMASQVLRTGAVSLSGEGYNPQTISLGRDSSLTVALSGGSLWSATSTADPLANIETWAANAQSLSGVAPEDVILSIGAWKAFRKFLEADDTRLSKLFEYARSSDSKVELGPVRYSWAKPKFMGNVGEFRIWTYSGQYLDESGATQNIMPDGSFTMVATECEGTSAYGMIHDEKAQFSSPRYFAKSWLEEDPAVRWLLSQSAPMLFTARPNATVGGTVL